MYKACVLSLPTSVLIARAKQRADRQPNNQTGKQTYRQTDKRTDACSNVRATAAACLLQKYKASPHGRRNDR